MKCQQCGVSLPPLDKTCTPRVAQRARRLIHAATAAAATASNTTGPPAPTQKGCVPAAACAPISRREKGMLQQRSIAPLYRSVRNIVHRRHSRTRRRAAVARGYPPVSGASSVKTTVSVSLPDAARKTSRTVTLTRSSNLCLPPPERRFRERQIHGAAMPTSTARRPHQPPRTCFADRASKARALSPPAPSAPLNRLPRAPRKSVIRPLYLAAARLRPRTPSQIWATRVGNQPY